MIRHRVHMIITAEQLPRPVSFRTDVILDRRDPDKAYALAVAWLTDQDPLTSARVLQCSSIDMQSIAPGTGEASGTHIPEASEESEDSR